MFTPSLDHLHIIVMLFIALFSFRAYNRNTLAIEYEPQEEKIEQMNDQGNQEVPSSQEKTIESSEINSENVDNVPDVDNSPSVDVVAVEPENSINVEEANSANIQSDLEVDQNKQNEATTVQGSFQKIDDESAVMISSESLEKEEDQESTLIRGESRMEQQECDEENLECSSSSGDLSSVSSSGESDEQAKQSRREKIKRIKKAKRVQKKNLRREQHQMTDNRVQLIEIQ